MKQQILRSFIRRVIAVIDAYHDVPTKDATTDAVMSDVVGKKDDTGVVAVGTTKTVIAYVKGILNTVIAQKPYTTTGVIVEDTSDGTPKTVTVTSSASANTFGSWVEVDASTSANSELCSIIVFAGVVNGGSDGSIIEVGVDESTIIRISFNATAARFFVYTLSKPIRVASGAQISVRSSDEQASGISSIISIQYYQTLN